MPRLEKEQEERISEVFGKAGMEEFVREEQERETRKKKEGKVAYKAYLQKYVDEDVADKAERKDIERESKLAGQFAAKWRHFAVT